MELRQLAVELHVPLTGVGMDGRLNYIHTQVCLSYYYLIWLAHCKHKS